MNFQLLSNFSPTCPSPFLRLFLIPAFTLRTLLWPSGNTYVRHIFMFSSIHFSKKAVRARETAQQSSVPAALGQDQSLVTCSYSKAFTTTITPTPVILRHSILASVSTCMYTYRAGKGTEGWQFRAPRLGQQAGSLDKGTCCQAWRPESDPWNLHSRGENLLHTLMSDFYLCDSM